MTVIAWDGKTLAADKRACAQGLAFAVTKIFRNGDALVAFAGEAGRIGEFRAWLEDGADPKKYPKNEPNADDYVWMTVIRPGGAIEKYEGTGYPIIVEEKQFATGSGRDYALAAMYLGCDAKTAVDIACKFDVNCGNGIDTLTVESAAASG